MTKKTFSCSQQELYTVCNIGWQSCNQYLGQFSDFKARYTAPYIEGRQEEIAEAANLPDAQARAAQSEILRIQLEEKAATCLSNWQKLKRYILDAWQPNLQKPNLEAAGQNYYSKAGENNWEAVASLVQSGSTFISTNSATLQANENMPASFQVTFDNAKAAFTENHQEFIESEQAKVLATETKMLANNNIHAKVMAMFMDGQELFKDNEALKKQFVFEQVLTLASGTGSAGLKGTISDANTETPVVGAIVTILPTGRTTASDEEGKYHFTQLAADEYAVTITAEGYQSFSADQTINTGVTSTLNAALTATS
jgi:Carboxypeptidase regulatory-like domain